MVDELPYIIVFAVFVLIILALTIWVIWLYRQSNLCASDPNIWCWNNIYCLNNCPDDTYGTCFLNNGTQASQVTNGPLAECLYGPTGAINSIDGNNTNGCVPSDTNTGSLTQCDPVCSCTLTSDNTSNCLQGCPTSLKGASGNCNTAG